MPDTPTGSKPGTPKKSSRRSSKAASRVSSAKTRKSDRPKSGTSEPETPSGPPPLRAARGDELEEGEIENPPSDIRKVFLSAPTQNIFSIIADDTVTLERPFAVIGKKAIQDDLFKRAAVSDFSVIKDVINNYDGENILVAYDYWGKYGENFYVATTEEAKERILYVPPEEGEGAVGEDGQPLEEEDLTNYEYQPTTSKPWESLGSEAEIQETMVTKTRGLVVQRLSRKRRLFGHPVEFKDRGPMASRDGYQECVDKSNTKEWEVFRKEAECGVQAVKIYDERAAQTNWPYPTNQTTQYEPREFDQETRDKLAESTEVIEAAQNSLPRFHLSLQHNEVSNPFVDDWKELAVEDTTFGSKADSYLQEFQSFTDLKNSKNKTVTWVDWHPTIKGIVAVSYGERCLFEDRIDNLSKIQVMPSLILVWSFADPIQPLLILEAPDDISSFRWNPTDPNVIAGGCINGQIIVWDIAQFADRLKRNKRGGGGGGGTAKANTMNTLPGYVDEGSIVTPVVYYCAVSSIEHSHKNWVTDLQWVPDHMDITRHGQIFESHKKQCSQIVTCGTDGYLMFWDIRAPKGTPPPKVLENPLRVSNTYKHLDLTWKPLMRIPVSRGENQDLVPFCFNYRETQGDRSLLPTPDPEEERAEEERRKEAEKLGLRPSSPREKKVLQGASTSFFVGTEDGQLVFMDWTLEKDTDSGKLVHKAPEWVASQHDGPVKSVLRSPFNKDILLTIGGWSFALWHVECQVPLLTSRSHNHRITAGAWSPSRPSVFFMSKADGNVDVWDLLDRTCDPVLSQPVSPHSVTRLAPFRISSQQQLLAIGDSHGTLHVLEVPWVFRQPAPKENQALSTYLDRERARLGYMEERRDRRFDDKRKIDNEEKRIAQEELEKSKVTDEEQQALLQREYQEYLVLEDKLQLELGLKEEEFEPLEP